jgi:iron complex outermembrane recepter protein
VDQRKTANEPSVERKDEQASKKKPMVLEEVIVTGSRIPTVAGQQVLPVRSYSRQDIEQSGQTTISEFLNTLPDASISASEGSAFSPGGFGDPGRTTVRLHGLPLGTTLVLLNGRRVEQGVTGFFDLSTIPVSAIERVEVMPVGASAIYGADALGGAVNIILRQNLNGFEVNGKFAHAADLNDTDANLGWGKSWERGSVSLVGTYQDRGNLLGSQRTLTSTIQLPAGVPPWLFLTDACSPGNVYSLDGQNLPGLSSPHAAIPAGISGTPTTQQFAGTAGQLNQCNTFRTTALVPQAQREGALLSAHYQMAGSMDLFTEILFSHQHLHPPSDSFINASGAILGANNPYNPFGKDVGVSFASDFPTSYEASGSLIRPLIGMRGSLFSAWHYEATAYLSRDRYQLDIPLTFYGDPILEAALNSSNPATALNPFTTGAPSPALQSLVASARQYHQLYVGRLVDGQAVLRGPLFHLPAGPLETVLGSEFGQEKHEKYVLINGANLTTPLASQRNTYAVFSEARVPLLADYAHPQLGDRLALTLAGRYDHTNDFGGKATWQGGLLWRPTETISMNGSYGVSYKAPQLREISGGVSFAYATTYPDPLRGNQLDSVNQIFGANPNLKPETGDSLTLGIVYSSRALEGLETSLTYFNVNISNFIARPSATAMINNPNLYPGGIIRGPATPQDQQQGFPGAITQINDLYYNFGDVHVAGVDADVRYAINTGVGEFAPSLAVANIYRWQTALVPGAPSISAVSQALGFGGVGFAPRWKGTAALRWRQGPLSANLVGRYTGRYKDYQEQVPNSNELGNFWIFDLNLRYDAGRALTDSPRWVAGTYLSLGAINLFDKAPPFSYGYPTYDYTQYDIRGRIVYAQIGLKW